VRRFFNEFYSRFIKDETPRLAAALAFYTLFALAPLLLLIMTTASLLGVDRRMGLATQVETLVSPQVADAVRVIVTAAGSRKHWQSLLGISGGVIWILSASLLFSELRAALNRIFSGTAVPFASSGFKADIILFLKSRTASLLMVFAFTAMALASLRLSAYFAFGLRGQSDFLIHSLHIGISGLVDFVFFFLGYRFVPTHAISWKRSVAGAAITSVLFVAGKELIGIYLTKAAFGSAYGAAGSLIVLLVWVYYSSLIIFAGAQLTMVLMPEEPAT
jgi:membrane protein